MAKRWSKEEIDILKENYHKLKIRDINLLLPIRNEDTIWAKAKSLGLRSWKTWSDEEIELLKNNYLNNLNINLKQLFPNRSISGIAHKGYRAKLGQKDVFRYKANEDFFSIPNPINSYLAGFIAADGNILIRKDTGEHVLRIDQKDKSVLILFKKLLNFQGNVRINKRKSHICHILTISSRKICDDLKNNFNIVPNKSLILKQPRLNNYLSLCYIIGLVDGDGCITFRNKNKPNSIILQVTGTKEICDFVKNTLKVGSIHHSSKTGKNTYTYACSFKNAREIIYKLRAIKELENIRFARKWNKIFLYEKSII